MQIENDGPRIVATDYWRTEHARRGLCYLSLNAGALRLLLPESQSAALASMSTARVVIASWGPWQAAGGRESIELLFDDDSQSPFALHLMQAQSDRRPLATDDARERRCTVWTPEPGHRDAARCALDLPCRIRFVAQVPWLRPWTREDASAPRE